jgi:Rrf2 family cysteine metabolism transcriptional repressor
MPISAKTEYAARAMIHLAINHRKDFFVKTDSISFEQHIPKKYLEQILLQLKSKGLVQSKSGLNGGYKLSKQPSRITIADIIRAVEGPLAPVQCVSKSFYIPCSVADESRCALRTVWQEARDKFVAVLEKITLEDVVSRTKKLEGKPESDI